MIGTYNWQKMPGEEIKPVIDSVNDIFEIMGHNTVKAETAEVIFTPLPFYREIFLIEIDDSSWPSTTGPVWFLEKQGRFFILDGSSAPIHDANEAGPVSISWNTVLSYLDFFCFFVHGEEGPFFIVESIDHPALDTASMNEETKKTIENAIQPATCKLASEAGTFEAAATILYGNALFSASFAITNTGMIEMIDDEPIAADLPVRKIKPNY